MGRFGKRFGGFNISGENAGDLRRAKVRVFFLNATHWDVFFLLPNRPTVLVAHNSNLKYSANGRRQLGYQRDFPLLASPQ